MCDICHGRFGEDVAMLLKGWHPGTLLSQIGSSVFQCWKLAWSLRWGFENAEPNCPWKSGRDSLCSPEHSSGKLGSPGGQPCLCAHLYWSLGMTQTHSPWWVVFFLSRTPGGTLRSSDGDGGFHKPRFWCPNLWKQWTLTKLMTPG